MTTKTDGEVLGGGLMVLAFREERNVRALEGLEQSFTSPGP